MKIFVDQFHERRYGGIEVVIFFDVVGDLPDRLVRLSEERRGLSAFRSMRLQTFSIRTNA